MVAFCHECNQSLPYADTIIVDGREEPAPGFVCPSCEKQANRDPDQNPNPSPSSRDDHEPLPDSFRIENGEIVDELQ